MEGPVGWDGVTLFGVGLEISDDAFQCVVFADEFEGGVGTDFGDGVEVVAAEEDA